jgi:hypothetical protein
MVEIQNKGYRSEYEQNKGYRSESRKAAGGLVEASTPKCSFCIDGNRPINIAESNKNFIIARIKEENLDEAITISRIAWDN